MLKLNLNSWKYSTSEAVLWLRYQCHCSTHPQSYHGQSECWVVEGANAIVLGPQLHIWSYFYMLSQTFFSTNVVWCSFFNVHMSSTKTVDSLIQFLDFQLRLFVDPKTVELCESYKCIQNKPLRSRYMKQNTDFHEGISQA